MTKETPYKNREIDTLMEEIKETLNRIESQTLKTNGSIARANEKISLLENWKATTLGLFSAGTIVAGLIIYIWNTQMSNIEASINDNSNSIQTYMNASVSNQEQIIDKQKQIINNL